MSPELLAIEHLNEHHSSDGRYIPLPETMWDMTPVEVLAYLHRNGDCDHFESLRELYGT